MAAPPQRNPGDRLGPYALVRRLGEGSIGEVWEAVLHGPAAFRKPVALKLLRPGSVTPATRDVLLHEARLGALLQHPNVVGTLQLAEHDGSWCLALELVRGMSVDALCRHAGGRLPPGVVLDVGIQAAAGLHHVHEFRAEGVAAGLVHRDVKPGNLLVDRTGLVKLADLGICHLRGEPGKAAGTPGYMAPEQVQGRAEARSDLFALGALLYGISTGRRPFGRGTEAIRTIAKVETLIATESFLAPAEEAVRGLGGILRWCLRHAPADRPRSARELLEALAALRSLQPPGPTLLEVLARASPELGLDADRGGADARAPERQPAAAPRRLRGPQERARRGRGAGPPRAVDRARRPRRDRQDAARARDRPAHPAHLPGERVGVRSRPNTDRGGGLRRRRGGPGRRARGPGSGRPARAGPRDEGARARAPRQPRAVHPGAAGDGGALARSGPRRRVPRHLPRRPGSGRRAGRGPRAARPRRRGRPVRRPGAAGARGRRAARGRAAVRGRRPVPARDRARGRAAAPARRGHRPRAALARAAGGRWRGAPRAPSERGRVAPVVVRPPLPDRPGGARPAVRLRRGLRPRRRGGRPRGGFPSGRPLGHRPRPGAVGREPPAGGRRVGPVRDVGGRPRVRGGSAHARREGGRRGAARGVLRPARDGRGARGARGPGRPRAAPRPGARARQPRLRMPSRGRPGRGGGRGLDAGRRELGAREARTGPALGRAHGVRGRAARPGGVRARARRAVPRLRVPRHRGARARGSPVRPRARDQPRERRPRGGGDDAAPPRRPAGQRPPAPRRPGVVRPGPGARSGRGRQVHRGAGARGPRQPPLGGGPQRRGAPALRARRRPTHRALGQRRREGIVLGNLGMLHSNLGLLAQARRYLEEAIAIHRESGDVRSESTAVGNLAQVVGATGSRSEERQLHEVALELARQVGDRRHEAIELGNLAGLDALDGRAEQALRGFTHALGLQREIGNRRSQGILVGHVGRLHWLEGRLAEARAYTGEALALHRAVGNRAGEFTALADLCRILCEERRPHEARALGEKAVALAREVGEPVGEALASTHAARAIAADVGPEPAARLLARAEELLGAVRVPRILALVRLAQAEVLHSAGDPEGAWRALEEAATLAPGDAEVGRELRRVRIRLES